jgi:hypothetical protein
MLLATLYADISPVAPSAYAVAHIRTKPVIREIAVAADMIALERATDGVEMVASGVGIERARVLPLYLRTCTVPRVFAARNAAVKRRRRRLRYTRLGRSRATKTQCSTPRTPPSDGNHTVSTDTPTGAL